MAQKKRITVPTIRSFKRKNKKIVMITAYDATFARLVDQAGADMVLVGDSLGMVVQGHDSTIPVTLDEVIYHCRCVSRGLCRAHLCGDLPFMTYKVSKDQALLSAARLIQEGRAESVKLEGGREIAETVAKITSSGIPVVGHVGLTPQSFHSMGGFKTQGKTEEERNRILDDAKSIEQAGVFCMVLEGIPMELSKTITGSIDIPTIGIGAGPHCDGQVLVLYDMLGMNEDFKPKFLKKYAGVGQTVAEAVNQYASEVRRGQFPSVEHSTSIDEQRQDVLPLYGIAGNKQR